MDQSRTSITCLDDLAAVGQQLAAVACCAALTRVKDVLAAPASAAGLGEIVHLASLAQRIETSLEVGNAAHVSDDRDSAVLLRARALVLLGDLQLATLRFGEAAIALPPPGAQKSGATG